MATPRTVEANSISTSVSSRGDYGKAELLYQRELAMREKARGPDHREIATKAEPLYERAAAIKEKSAGPTQ